MKTFKEYIAEQNSKEEDEMKIHYPHGVYISVKLDEKTELAVREYQEKYLKGQKINDELHCTLIYSKKPQVEEIEPAEYTAVGTFKEFNLFGENSDTLVVEINSQDLQRRNEELVQKYRFISDFDEYKSHITLSYGIENIDLNSLPAIDFSFTFVDETVEQLNENWAGDDDTDNDTDNDTDDTLVGRAMKKDKDKQKKEDKDEDSSEADKKMKNKG
jgi:hypothetical protein